MNKELTIALNRYWAHGLVSVNDKVTGRNTSFYGGQTITKEYTIGELSNHIRRQPEQVVSNAIEVLARLIVENNREIDLVYWTNVANALLGTQNATAETGLTL